MNKILAGLLGIISYPLITLLTIIFNLVGLACLSGALILLAPVMINAVNSFFRGLSESVPHLAEMLPPEPSFTTSWFDNIKLRITFMVLSVFIFSAGLGTEVLSLLYSPWTGLMAGAKDGFTGLFSALTERLFNPFSLRQFAHDISETMTLDETGENFLQNINPGLQPNEITQLTEPETTPESEHMAASWAHATRTQEDASCPILLDVPESEDIIVFEKQYLHANDEWRPIENTAQIFSRQALHTHLSGNHTHPLTRDAIRAPSNHTEGTHTYRTRWRILPLNPSNQTVIDTLLGYRQPNHRTQTPPPTRTTTPDNQNETAHSILFFGNQTETTPDPVVETGLTIP